MRLGKMLRLYRLTEGLGQRELAATLGLTPSTLNRIEAGKSCDVQAFGTLIAWLVEEPTS